MKSLYVKYSTVQYSAIEKIKSLYSTVQYSAIEEMKSLYSTVQYSTVKYRTVRYNTIQDCTVRCGKDCWTFLGTALPLTAKYSTYHDVLSGMRM